MQPLLDILLDSWERSNTILVNLLHALPSGSLGIRVGESSSTLAQLFTHIHFVRLVFVQKGAPEFATILPAEEWSDCHDSALIGQMLNESAQTVRDAVKSRVETARSMDRH